MSEKKRKKSIVLGCLMWGWNQDFPVEELKRFVNKENVKDITDIDMGSSDNVLLVTSKKVSKRKAYDLFNMEMRERFGDENWNDISPSN